MIKFMPDSRLYEESQTTSVRFAIAEKRKSTYFQLHPFVKCRDFLGDVLHALENRERVFIYGFDFSGSVAVKEENLFLLLEADKHELQNIEDSLEIIYNLEERISKQKTRIIDKKEDKYLLIEFPKEWIQTNLLFSLYTFLLRCCSYKINNPKDNWIEQIVNTDGREARYLSGDVTVHWFKKFLEILPKIKQKESSFSGYEYGENIEKVHSCSGFIYLLKYLRLGDDYMIEKNYYGQKLKQFLVLKKQPS